jgi:TolB-like protein
VLAVLAPVAAVALAVRLAERAPTAAPLADIRLRQQIVVAPFRVTGASPSLAYLREGLVELLSARLADDSATRAVDAGAVLSAWRRAGLAGDADVPRETVVRLAARLGAERVVIGSVVGTRSRAVLTAAVVAVPAGTVSGAASVEGPADSVSVLVDRLAARLLVQTAGEEGALAEQTTNSLPALRAFLAGQAAFRRHDYDVALRAYERALVRDSTFALAALQLARAAARFQSAEAAAGALAVAWAGREALSVQDRALLSLLTGPAFPAPSSSADQLAAWARPSASHPTGPTPGSSWGPSTCTPVRPPGCRTPTPARRRPYGARWRSTRAMRRRACSWPSSPLAKRRRATSVRPTPRSGTPPDRSPRSRAGRVAVARGEPGTLARIRDTFPQLGRANLRAIVRAAQFDGVALDDARRALQVLRARSAGPPDRATVAHGRAQPRPQRRAPRCRGRRAGASAGVAPGAHGATRLAVLDALYGDGDARAGAASAGALQQERAHPGDLVSPAERASDACVLAQWRLLSQNDTTHAPRGHGVASHGPRSLDRSRASRARRHHLCAPNARRGARRHHERPRRGRAPRAARLARAHPATAGDAVAYAPVLVARLHARLGRPRDALAAVRRRVYMVGWPRYLATAWREEGRYAGHRRRAGRGARCVRAVPHAARGPRPRARGRGGRRPPRRRRAGSETSDAGVSPSRVA